jgi:hypothetical protein
LKINITRIFKNYNKSQFVKAKVLKLAIFQK